MEHLCRRATSQVSWDSRDARSWNDWCCPFFIIIRINLCAMAILFCFRNWNLNRLILAGPITVVWCLASITWNTGGPLSSPALNLQDVNIARIKSEQNKESGASSSVLHNQKTQSNLAQDQGSVEPDVIVFGVGDSGTRGINEYLERAGHIHMCDGQHTAHSHDCRPTRKCHNSYIVQQMLVNQPLQNNETRQDRPQLSAMKETGPGYFQALVECEKNQSQKVLNGIREHAATYQSATSESVASNAKFWWGYKNPRHSYIFPVLLEAFGDATAMIFVARHPYDICSGRNQKQFTSYGSHFGTTPSVSDTAAVTGSRYNNGTTARDDAELEPSCMEFWYQMTSQILSLIEENFHLARLVKVESLVLGSSQQRKSTGQCLSKIVGYPYQPKAARDAAEIMGQHKDAYGGQSRSSVAKELRNLAGKDSFYSRWQKSVRDTTPKMHKLAKKLGYNLTAYGGTLQERDEWLLSPATSAVVC